MKLTKRQNNDSGQRAAYFLYINFKALTLPTRLLMFMFYSILFLSIIMKAHDIRQWLASIKCQQYFDKLISNGYDDINFYHELDIEDLIEIGVDNDADRVKVSFALSAVVLILFYFACFFFYSLFLCYFTQRYYVKCSQPEYMSIKYIYCYYKAS